MDFKNLKVGQIIECESNDEIIETMQALAKLGYETDFDYCHGTTCLVIEKVPEDR